MCAHWRSPAVEPMILSPLLRLPRQKVAIDLFKLDDKHCLSMIDYYSRYIELIELRFETADNVINAMKSIFARHGIAAAVCNDNSSFFAAHSFLQFTKKYGFTHVTNSPRYAQGKGEAECSVQTAKNLLRKSTDRYLALLAYRITHGLQPPCSTVDEQTTALYASHYHKRTEICDAGYSVSHSERPGCQDVKFQQTSPHAFANCKTDK